MGLGGGMYRIPQEMMAMPQMGPIVEDEPLYVNAKQYNRILKRRQARAKIDAMIRQQKAAGEKPAYMHESRHRHAMKRPRGPGGRFLTAAEIAALKAKETNEQVKDGSDSAEKTETESNSSGSTEPNKKSKPIKA